MNCSHCNIPLRKFTKRNDFDGRPLHLKCWKKLQNKQKPLSIKPFTLDDMMNVYDLFKQVV
jgi:hypothetical protein